MLEMNINWTTLKTIYNNIINFNWVEWFYLPTVNTKDNLPLNNLEDIGSDSIEYFTDSTEYFSFSDSTDSFKSLSSNDSDNLYYDTDNNDSGYNSPVDLILEDTSNSFIPLVVIGFYSKLKNIGLISFIPRILTILITRITINILMLIILAIILYALGYFDEPSGVFYIDQTVLLILHIYKLFISLLLKIANFLCFYIIKVINLLEWIWKWRNF
jgi:hypothetical protein